jgi:hypothetical protein
VSFDAEPGDISIQVFRADFAALCIDCNNAGSEGALIALET